MQRRWTEAGGQFRFSFMKAVSQIYEGEYLITCPKCQQAMLRFYYHIMSPARRTGTLWVWCPSCRTVFHSPYLDPPVFQDPFESMDPTDLAQHGEGFYDLVNRLWEEGRIGYPNAVT